MVEITGAEHLVSYMQVASDNIKILRTCVGMGRVSGTRVELPEQHRVSAAWFQREKFDKSAGHRQRLPPGITLGQKPKTRRQPRRLGRSCRRLRGRRTQPVHQLSLERSRRRYDRRRERQLFQGFLQPVKELSQFRIRPHGGDELPFFRRAEFAECVKRRLFLLLFGHLAFSGKLSRNLRSPRRIRALIVPSGSLSRSAICGCVSPRKKASSMAWRWSAGKPCSAARTSPACSNPAASLSGLTESGSGVVSWSCSFRRFLRWRDRYRSIARCRAMLKAQ